MDSIEAIKRIKDHMRVHGIGEYPHIHLKEALDIAIEALEKRIPVEHHHTMVGEIHDDKVRTSICPNCLGCILTVAEEFPKFCTWCGQAIDWEK